MASRISPYKQNFTELISKRSNLNSELPAAVIKSIPTPSSRSPLIDPSFARLYHRRIDDIPSTCRPSGCCSINYESRSSILPIATTTTAMGYHLPRALGLRPTQRPPRTRTRLNMPRSAPAHLMLLSLAPGLLLMLMTHLPWVRLRYLPPPPLSPPACS